ncbi:unnamed protein product [Phytophthora fragariaefolia]|uniref:Unnamed protein product n=1 Tax=Phytophthora fragariaefolia TaxID=1490495 RepID=A0A9W6XVA7_9STRA|nr:unnamed protein product [Phytophthora fragariaefolia]
MGSCRVNVDGRGLTSLGSKWRPLTTRFDDLDAYADGSGEGATTDAPKHTGQRPAAEAIRLASQPSKITGLFHGGHTGAYFYNHERCNGCLDEGHDDDVSGEHQDGDQVGQVQARTEDEEDNELSGGETGARQSSGNDGRGKTRLDRSRVGAKGRDRGDAAPAHDVGGAFGVPVATNDEYESVETTSGVIGENSEAQTAPTGGPAEFELQPSAPAASTSVTEPTRRTASTMGNTSTAGIPPTTTMSDWGTVTTAIREFAGRIEGLLSVSGSTGTKGPSSTVNWATVAAALQPLTRILAPAQPTATGRMAQQPSVPQSSGQPVHDAGAQHQCDLDGMGMQDAVDDVGALEAVLHRRMGVTAAPRTRVTITGGRALDDDVRGAAASRNPASGTAPIAPGALTTTPATGRADEGAMVDSRRKSVKDLEQPTFTPSPKVSVSTWIDRDGECGQVVGRYGSPDAKKTWTNLKKALLRRYGEKLDKSAAEWRVSMRRMMPGETHADFAASLRDVVGRNKVSERVLLAQFYRCLDETTKKLVKQHPKPRTLEEAVDKATEIDDPMDNVAQGMINIGTEPIRDSDEWHDGRHECDPWD